MSDYMFMLENHLSAQQNRVVSEVQAVAQQAGVNLFLTGGAVRDMLGGFPIRDLDFTVEGQALKLARTVARKTGGRVLQLDQHKKSADLLFPGGVTAEIAMARREHHTKIGRRPRISPATIHEDLHGRDFALNSIALSLNRASLGLLLDPNNGSADLERRELRAVHNYVFYHDPGRILRLVRFRIRFGFTVEEKTQQQYDNARGEQLETYVPPRRLYEELRQIAEELHPGEVLRALEEEGLLRLFSPALTGSKLNLSSLARLQRAKQMIPFGVELPLDHLTLFLYFLTERLTPKEKAALIKATAMRKKEVESWRKLDARSRKRNRELKSAKLKKASQIYQALSNAPGEEVLLLLLRSPHRLVQDRIRKYLQKYLPAAQEVTDLQVAAAGAAPGTPKYRKLREEMIAARLDGRIRKAAQPPETPPEGEQPPRVQESTRRGTHAPHRSPKLFAGRQSRLARPRR